MEKEHKRCTYVRDNTEVILFDSAVSRTPESGFRFTEKEEKDTAGSCNTAKLFMDGFGKAPIPYRESPVNND